VKNYLNIYKAYKPWFLDLIKKPFISKRKGLNNLDKKLQKYLKFKNGFFIEAGAYDGIDQSNTYFLEKTKRWDGILIEPIPESFKKIALNRTTKTVNCALVDDNYNDTHISMNYAGLMSVTENAMKPDRVKEHVNIGKKLHGFKNSYIIRVKARTLSSIIEQFGSPKVDFLSLDVEGAENMVLNGIDFSKHRPKFILIEERDHHATKSLLEKSNYIQIEQLTEHDFLYSESNN
jgi:FkbM family methyltransferase